MYRFLVYAEHSADPSNHALQFRDGHQSGADLRDPAGLAIWPESEKMSSEFYYGATFIVAMIFLNSYLKWKRGMAGKQSVDSIR